MMKFPIALTSLFLSASIALSGCVSVLPDAEPASERYFINDVTPAASTLTQAAWALSIEDPSAIRALDTTKIAISRAPGKVEYFAGGEWSDRAPRLIGTALIRSFENTERILGVGSRVSLPHADFILQTDIRDFHVVKTGGREVVKTAVYVRLTDSRSNVLAAKLFSREAEIEEEKITLVVQQIDQSLAGIMTDIVEWTFEEAEDAYAK